MTTLLCFGDSITYGALDSEGGWVARLRKSVYEKHLSDTDYYCLVYNLAIDGDDSKGLLERMESEIKARSEEKPLIAIISIGMNDSLYNKKGKKNKTDLENFKNNLEVLTLIAKRHSERIIFVGLNPADERVDPISWLKDCCYMNEYIEKYNDAIEEFCKEEGLGFVSIFNEWLKEDYSSLLEDGVHPNSEGHKRIFEAVRDVLKGRNLI